MESTPQQEHAPANSKSSARSERKHKVLTQGRASLASSIASAISLKKEAIYFLFDHEGEVPFTQDHGLGLYYKDCRYLNGYRFRFNNKRASAMSCDASAGFSCHIQMANPELPELNDGSIGADRIGIHLTRVINSKQCALLDSFCFENYTLESASFKFTIELRCDFEDVFEVRGLLSVRSPRKIPLQDEQGALWFQRHGKDHITRKLTANFSPGPDRIEKNILVFQIDLEPRGTKTIEVKLAACEINGQPSSKFCNSFIPADSAEKKDQEEWEAWHHRITDFTTNSEILSRVIRRSMVDLFMLQTHLRGNKFFAAGVPWFVTLFGRDSIIAALQTLAFMPQITAPTLRLLASYQGKAFKKWRDEVPGKIMHELRRGELANIGAIPQLPYYGSVDATILFLILSAEYYQWTADLELFHEILPAIDAALNWLEHQDHHGYITYHSSSSHGLENQGWKDSGNAIVDADGSLAQPPIALVEVQAYAYMARMAIAELYEALGNSTRAAGLRQTAHELKGKFETDFWLAEQKFYALALQANSKPLRVISSNPGHALWAGIAAPKRAALVAERLMQDDMFNGWGVRTLAQSEKAFNPVGYHLGTVWPHDNSLIAAGLRNYGLDDAALRIADGIFEAATYFEHFSLPELFCGYKRSVSMAPVPYPVACHPQAWGAATPLYLLTTMLGLVPEAPQGRLQIIRPYLPRLAEWVELRRLSIGNARLDLRFERASHDGRATAKILSSTGNIDVVFSDHPRYSD